MRPRATRLPLEPLLRDYEVIRALARALRRDPSQVSVWARDGVPVYTADKLAIALGHHPSEYWPEWFDLAEAESSAA